MHWNYTLLSGRSKEQLYIFNYTGLQLIIDTHVEEICTLCGEESNSSSLLVLRLESYVSFYTSTVESLVR